MIEHDSQQLFKRILLIEDTPAHLMLIQRALKGLSESVITASTLAEGEILLTQDLSIDLVITDLHLPDHPASDPSASASTVQRLINACGHTPLLVLTSSTSLKEAIAALRSGARDYVVKNFNHEFADIMSLTLQRVAAESSLLRQKQLADLKIKALSYAIEHSEDGFALANDNGEYLFTNNAFVRFVVLSGGTRQSLLDLVGPQVVDFKRLREEFKARLFSVNSAGAVWQVELMLSGDLGQAFELTVFSIPEGAIPEQLSPRVTEAEVNFIGQSSAQNQSEPQSGHDRQSELSHARNISSRGENAPVITKDEPCFLDESCFLVVWVRDITALKQREKLQRDLISTTSHDLKGPLSSILLSAEILADKRTAQEKAEILLNRMVSSAQGALQMIDELLSARIIREGAFDLKPQPLNLPEVVNALIEQFEVRAAAKGVAIKFEHSLNSRDQIWSLDLVAFQRILANLISNAVKFTSQGGEIRVVLYEADDHLIIQVNDTGSGMDRHEARNLFERFSRLESHHEIEGTGLGLFIVRSLTQALGGSIEVFSEKGRGTSFRLKFPNLTPNFTPNFTPVDHWEVNSLKDQATLKLNKGLSLRLGENCEKTEDA